MHATPAVQRPTTRAGASGHPQWGRKWLPIVPPGCCELCHRPADVLATINVAATETTRQPVYIFVCRRHANGNGTPVATPCTTVATGAPAQPRLFDVIPYDRRAGRHG